jgi:hypothetical protein
MATTGVEIASGREGVGRGRVVHHASVSWEITSNHTHADVLHVPLLPHTLPGSLGTYILPHDAVFTLHGARATRCADWASTLASQRKCARPREASAVMVHQRAAPLPDTTGDAAQSGDDDAPSDDDDAPSDDDDAPSGDEDDDATGDGAHDEPLPENEPPDDDLGGAGAVEDASDESD